MLDIFLSIYQILQPLLRNLNWGAFCPCGCLGFAFQLKSETPKYPKPKHLNPPKNVHAKQLSATTSPRAGSLSYSREIDHRSRRNRRNRKIQTVGPALLNLKHREKITRTRLPTAMRMPLCAEGA